MIYILKHKNPNFTGFFGGVAFEKGVGSTSSTFDRDKLVAKGFKDITDEFWAKKKKEEAAKKAKEAKEAKKKETKEEKK